MGDAALAEVRRQLELATQESAKHRILMEQSDGRCGWLRTKLQALLAVQATRGAKRRRAQPVVNPRAAAAGGGASAALAEAERPAARQKQTGRKSTGGSVPRRNRVSREPAPPGGGVKRAPDGQSPFDVLIDADDDDAVVVVAEVTAADRSQAARVAAVDLEADVVDLPAAAAQLPAAAVSPAVSPVLARRAERAAPVAAEQRLPEWPEFLQDHPAATWPDYVSMKQKAAGQRGLLNQPVSRGDHSDRHSSLYRD